MKKKDVAELSFGLYRLYWKEGGSSLASVGQNANGDLWFAPTNWITVPCFDWKSVKRVNKILT